MLKTNQSSSKEPLNDQFHVPPAEMGGKAREPKLDHNKRTADWTRRLTFITSALVFTGVCQVAAAFLQWNAMQGQLSSMNNSGADTHNLAVATQNLATAGTAQATAANGQAAAMTKLEATGEQQAVASDKLRLAGEAQAASTKALADNSGKQIGALVESASAARVQADAARTQAAAITKSADASIIAGRATDRLALSGKAQADAVQASLGLAEQANKIALDASIAADRPWIEVGLPGQFKPIAGQDYTIEVPMRNTGRSPAIGVTTAVSLEIHDAKATFFELPPCGNNCQITTLFPTNQAFGNAGLAFHPVIKASSMTAAQVKRIEDGEDIIVLRTRVDYMDARQQSHLSITCSTYAPKLAGGSYTSCNGGTAAS